MMNAKVLSIFNNAKIFLSDQEMKELALYIDKDFGKPIAKKVVKQKSILLKNYTLESVTEKLLATTFRKKQRV